LIVAPKPQTARYGGTFKRKEIIMQNFVSGLILGIMGTVAMLVVAIW